MKCTCFLSVLHLLFCLFKLSIIILLIAGTNVHTNAQSQKFSKKEQREIQVDSILSQAELQLGGINQRLRYDYYFIDRDKEQLQNLSGKLTSDSFEIISLVQLEKKKWQLQAMKHQVHTRESIHEMDKHMKNLAYRLLVDDYIGFTIALADIDALMIPDEEFVPFIKSLEDELLFKVANDLLKKNSYDKAMVPLKESIDRHFKEDTANLLMGNALVATNEYVKGIEYWEKARNLNPKYLEAYMKLGIILFENSHFNQSLYNFQEADTIKPNDDQILYHIGETLYMLERYNESYTYTKRAVNVNRKNVYAKSLLKMLREQQVRKLRRQFIE